MATYKIIPAHPHKAGESQGFEVPNTRVPGQTGLYRNARWSDLQGELGRATLCDLFESGLRQSADHPCLGHREIVPGSNPVQWAPEYTWQTYREVDTRRKAIGSGIEHLFRDGPCLAGDDFEGVGIWAINRPEWKITDLGCNAYNKVTVALYDTLGPSAVEYVINHSQLSLVFSSSNHLQALIDDAEKTPRLKAIVSFDPLDATTKVDLTEAASKKGVKLMEFSELEAHGNAHPIEIIRPTLEQLASICYTSGTTSNPKGVISSHSCLASAALCHLHGMPEMPQDWSVISYLPLAHIFGRVAELLALATGARIGYFTGSPANLMADMRVLKPHFFPSVPRIFNRIYAEASAGLRAPGERGDTFRRAVADKMRSFKATGSTAHPIWDPLVFNAVKASLGGNVRWFINGSAPVNKDVLDFLKISLCCDGMEGYGLTETGACCTRGLADDPDASGTVGAPAPLNEVKLVDVAELSYLSTDKPNARGELCVRGANIFSCYYRDTESTNKAIDAEGWFHTGDVAEVDSMGRFKIIDRVKNIMKLSQGEYVALEKVENTYTACPVIRQLYLHGDSLQDSLVAVIVPDPKVLSELSREAGHEFDHNTQMEEAFDEPAVKKAVLDNLTAHAKKAGLKGFEQIRGVHLTTRQFTIENGTLTPTFKIRRKDAHEMYKEEIAALYPKKK